MAQPPCRVWLDAHRRPHQTGRHVTLANREVLSEIELWDDTPSEPPPTYGSAALEDEKPPHPPPSIMGPVSSVFPRNTGWYVPEQQPSTTVGKIRKLSDLTIHTR